MDLILKINCDNDAFGDLDDELCRIFDQIAQRYAGRYPGEEIPTQIGESRKIVDWNGQTVGYWEMVDC